MADYWDNVEIMRVIDRWQQESYKGGPVNVNGLSLMERLIEPSLTTARFGQTASPTSP